MSDTPFKTWTYTAEEPSNDGGFVVPMSVELLEDHIAFAAPLFWSLLFKPRSWEERLATAIEERSVRNRIKRGVTEARYRVTTARDILLGTHYCGDD
jgi:hypothetical protein